MGLDAAFYTNEPPEETENVYDIDEHDALHDLICGQRGEIVYPGYNDFYIDAKALEAIAYDIERKMSRLGLPVTTDAPWVLDNSIPVDASDHEGRLPYYLRVIRALEKELRPGDAYIYSYSC